jgi:hypothetical protein
MTLDLDNMTQAKFDNQMAEIKEKRPNLLQFISIMGGISNLEWLVKGTKYV